MSQEAYRVLRWTCVSCGFSQLCPMPGFLGDGLKHYANGDVGCGPLVAACVGFLRAPPGAALDELEAGAEVELGR